MVAIEAYRPHLYGGRRGALLRRQHAGRGGAHFDLCAQQRDSAPLPWKSAEAVLGLA